MIVAICRKTATSSLNYYSRHNKQFRNMSAAQTVAQEQYDIIVIGAGMAGLACAAKILDRHTDQAESSSNIRRSRKLMVLEARDRIGGRIGSVRVNGNRLDTGANWIHGINNNPLVEILPKKVFKELSCSVSFRAPVVEHLPEQETVVDKTITETASDHDWVRLDAVPSLKAKGDNHGDLVIPTPVSGTMFRALWTLIGSIHQQSQEASAENAKKTSILQVMLKDKEFNKVVENVPPEYHATLAALPQFIENMEAGPLDASISPTGPNPTTGLGLLEYAIDDFDGVQAFLRDGYTAVIEEVGRKVIEQGHIKLGVEVTEIKWDSELIEVSTTAGKFFGKQVICTLPLGVLQHKLGHARQNKQNAFMSPVLPSSKIEAINSLGFGTLDKVFLVYSKPWWKEEPWLSIVRKGLTFQHVPGGDDDNVADDVADEPDSFWGFTTELPGLSIPPNSSSAVPGVRALSLMNLHALTGFPVLSCFVSCANAIHIEGLSDMAAGELVRRSLTQWFGAETPEPDAIHVTRWAQDEFSRGSYSHMITGLSERKHREAFGEPLVNDYGAVLRFAGEHTSEDHFATVHGALLSGWREADAVLQHEAMSAVGQ